MGERVSTSNPNHCPPLGVSPLANQIVWYWTERNLLVPQLGGKENYWKKERKIRGLIILQLRNFTIFGQENAQIMYIWVIDQAWGQDGWILAKFFFAYLWTETKSRPINTQYPAILTEQAWSIKELLYDLKHQKNDLWSCGTKREIPRGQYRSILPARVANHSARFGSSCPFTELVI